jgi:hypothetical protein
LVNRVALHQWIERLLLVGVSLPASERRPPAAPPPQQLVPLIESLAAPFKRFNRQAMRYGRRYRSGFWGIYLLSALAVLCAVLPLALGWDSTGFRHPYAGVFAGGEVVIIGTVVLIFWLGHHRDWQERWLTARTTAELTWYLPVVAPLLDHSTEVSPQESNWYPRLFDPGQQVHAADEVAKLCAASEPLARSLLKCAWSDPAFVSQYAQWTQGILEDQVSYHRGVAAKQHALLERVHGMNSWLFGLTALAAFAHLAVHTLWLTLLTTFFPALGASLHGAIAQSEAYRLGHTSGRLKTELRDAIDTIQRALEEFERTKDSGSLREAIMAAIALILEEHQDWHLLVRPHRLPLG